MITKTKGEELAELVRVATAKERIRADVIQHTRTGEEHTSKLFRLRRADGNEFAIQMKSQSFSVWSSVQPNGKIRLAKPAKAYSPDKTRDSGLDIMPRLCKPNRGRPGAAAWLLSFVSSGDALDFIANAL